MCVFVSPHWSWPLPTLWYSQSEGNRCCASSVCRRYAAVCGSKSRWGIRGGQLAKFYCGKTDNWPFLDVIVKFLLKSAEDTSQSLSKSEQILDLKCELKCFLFQVVLTDNNSSTNILRIFAIFFEIKHLNSLFWSVYLRQYVFFFFSQILQRSPESDLVDWWTPICSNVLATK